MSKEGTTEANPLSEVLTHSQDSRNGCKSRADLWKRCYYNNRKKTSKVIGKYKPYRKPNDDPLYIHKHSNHPPSILRQLPASINKRISTLSSDKQVFDDAVQSYQNALGYSNFRHELVYMPHVTQQPHRSRQRNIIWFNPPFSKNVKTNIARSFLKLVDTHFPIGNKLHKIFNRNTVKVSYSCI